MTAQRSILLPRMRSVWPLLLSVLLSTLIAASLVAAFAGFAATALPQAVSTELNNAAHKSVAISGAIDASLERTDDRVVRVTLADAFGAVPFTVDHAVRVRLEAEPDHIGVWPDSADPGGGPPGGVSHGKHAKDAR